ncbi:MAG: type II secretion system minor pseudopilin GspK [Pseudomonadota bacterium]
MTAMHFNRLPATTQTGAALLIALLAVALASLLAMSMVEHAQRDLARTEALVNAERAWQYASGMHGLALDWIEQAERAEAEGANGLIERALDGRWSTPLPIPGGSVTGRVFDISGRFNLNALASPVVEDAVAARLALERLFESLNLDRNLAEEITGWIGNGGSTSYSQAQPPYLRAGLPLLHISELNWLQRYNSNTRQRLLPLVSALPAAQHRVNINRVSPEVLAAWIDGLTLEQAERVLSSGPFDTLADALQQPELAGLNSNDFSRRFSVSSYWFLAQARVTLNNQPHDFFRLISRTGARYDFRYVSVGTQEPMLETYLDP